MDFPGGSSGRAFAYNARDQGSIPRSGRFPGEGNGNPLQYSHLEKLMDRGAYSPWGHKESDTTEITQHALMHKIHFLSMDI